MNYRYQVTEWGDVNDQVLTIDGVINYECWCQREVVRYKEKWCEAWLQVNDDGQVALFTWNDGEILPVVGDDPKE